MTKLMLDGKEIGNIDPSTKEVTDATGNKVTSEPPKPDDGPKLEIPLDSLTLKDLTKVPKPKADPPKAGDKKDDPAAPGESIELKILRKQNEALNQALQVATTRAAADGVPPGEASIDVLSLIPDDLDDEKDPLGVARTVKNLVAGLQGVSARVERMDQHTGFTEYNRALETEKADFKELFEDKQLGPIADKLLSAEIQQNPTQPLGVIVANVARQISGLKADTTKDDIKGKAETTKAVPPVLRSDSGAPPTITVDRPQNVRQAGEAYRAFRAAKGRFEKG